MKGEINPNKRKFIKFLKDNGLYIVLILISFYFSLFVEGFSSFGNISDILQQITFYLFLAIGMTFVIITAGIDLSVGSIVAVSAVVLAILIENKGIAICNSILISLAVGTFLGLFNGLTITKLNLPPFISTFATMIIGRGLALQLAQDTQIPILTEIRVYQEISSTGKIAGVPIIVIIVFIFLIIFWLILTKTRFGRYVFATGGNEQAAKLSGINTKQVKLIVYLISGFLSSLVGIFLAFKFKNGNPNFGKMWELDAIAAVVVGGTSLFGGKGSLFRTLIGALLIGILDNGLQLIGLHTNIIYIVKGLVILGAVMIDQIRT